jgi:uncharacterized protein (TIGR02246 family)
LEYLDDGHHPALGRSPHISLPLDMPNSLPQMLSRLLSISATVVALPFAVVACNEIQSKPFNFNRDAIVAENRQTQPIDETSADSHEAQKSASASAEPAAEGHATVGHASPVKVTQVAIAQPTAQPVVKPALPAKPLTPEAIAKEKQQQAERASVEAATTLWMATVTSGRPNAAETVMQLYAEDAMLLGTVSEQVRDQRSEIKSYFDYFTQLPRLSVSGYRSFVRVYGDTAINSGYYTFSYEKEGHTKVVPARFTFNYRRINGQWLIEDHHSSAIPKAPDKLTPAID